MIKNIIFDMGGVLIDLDRQKCLDAFSGIGFPDFGDYLSSYHQKGFFAAFENGDLTAEAFRSRVRQHILRPGVSDREIDRALNAFLVGIHPEKIKLLSVLKEKYHLYLLSNTNPVGWAYSRKLFLDTAGFSMESVFEKLFLSFEMNCSKPGVEIFRQVLSRADILAGESLFVDDGQANTETASRLGFKSLLYDVQTDLPAKVMEALQTW